MSLHEWRQRLKVMKAMTMLNQGKTIESIAFDLGYASASAFIYMFKRWMGFTPDQFNSINKLILSIIKNPIIRLIIGFKV